MSIELQEQEIDEKEGTPDEEPSPEQQESEEEQPETDKAGEETEEPELNLLQQLQEEGGITKRNDGKFEWVVDPDDPKSTRYVGTTLKELLENARKGFNDKDRYIAELKSRNFGVDKPGRRVARPEREEQAETDEDIESLIPNRDAIITDLMKERGLDPAMRKWSTAEWREYADEKGMRDFEVSRLQSSIERVENDGTKVYNEASIDYVDARTLKEASQEVKEYILDRKLDPDDFIEVYEGVVRKTWDDNSFRKSNGLFNGSKLVRVMIAEINKSLAPSPDRTKVEQKLDATKKAAEEAKKKIKAPSSSAAKPKVQDTAPKDIREAKRQLMAGITAGRDYSKT